jgi:hypothetical protein
MISSLEAKPGDCCYFLTRCDKKPKYGTITKIIAKESAVEVMEIIDGKFHTVWEKNAAWDEKEIKGQKWQKPHNYIRKDYVEIPDEKEPVKRVSNVRNRKTKRTRRKGTATKGKSVSKRTNRKS